MAQSKEFLRRLRKKHGLGEFKKSRSTRRGVKPQMARKRRSARRIFGGRRRSRSRGSSGMTKPLGVLVGGVAYGAFRAKLSNALAPVTAKIPLGNISDEVGLFAIHYLLNKKVKNKLVQNVTLAGMAVEAARMGEVALSGNLTTSNSTTMSQSILA